MILILGLKPEDFFGAIAVGVDGHQRGHEDIPERVQLCFRDERHPGAGRDPGKPLASDKLKLVWVPTSVGMTVVGL
ncbi:protein of unknown function [Hyphomicrobium sp. MC1]|nr:protein of unknown function [Hyphomicrobium sp. MC1]